MCLLGEPTEGKVVLGHFGALWLRICDARQLHPHRLQRGQARPELDPAHARGARRRAGVDPDVGGRPDERLPRREGDRQRRRDRGRLRLARLAHAAPHRPLPRRPRAADEADGRGAAARCSRWCAASRALPRLRRRGRGLRDRARRRDRRGPRARRRDRRGARGGLRRAARARRDALVLRRVRADALRHPDGQLRHLDRADGRRERREPRDRRPRRRRRRSTRSWRARSAGCA